MKIKEIKEKLMDYIANAPDEIVRALYTLLEHDIEKGAPIELTKEQLEILDEEDALHAARKTGSYNWGEAKQIIRGDAYLKRQDMNKQFGKVKWEGSIDEMREI